MSRISAKGRRAIVLGGGIAGLSAAGVLARHFEEVTILERDLYPDTPGVRPHAPQGAHVHILLAGGLYTLSQLIPELPAWLDEMGLPEGDLTHNVRLSYGGRWLPKARSGIPIRPCTRPIVEHLLWRDVSRRDNITILSGCEVKALVGSGSVRGVRISRGDSEEELDADLVVDAMGRSSRALKWLEAASVSRPKEETLDAGVVYASCDFAPPGEIDDDWTLIAASCVVPSQPQMGAIMRVGRDRLMGAFIGYGKPKPPRSPEELVERTAMLESPEIHRLLSASKPMSSVQVFANTQNRWRHYGRLSTWLDRFVVIGDAVCSLNPRHGQGMTVAALGAQRLENELRAYWRNHGRLDGFAHHFQKSLEQTLRIPWQMALMEDRLWVSTFSGKKPGIGERLMMKGTERLLKAVFSDLDTYVNFMRVAHLLDAPTSMLTPKTLAAIALGGTGGQIHREAPRVEVKN